MKYLDLHVLVDDGYLQEVNRTFFHPLGLALEADLESGTLRIWDYRDEQEGIYFVGVDLEAKADKLSEIREARRGAREKALGYFLQAAG